MLSVLITSTMKSEPGRATTMSPGMIFGFLVVGAAYMFIRSRRTPITPQNVNAEWEGGLVPADEREPAKTAS